jgi:hypothetical protein
MTLTSCVTLVKSPSLYNIKRSYFLLYHNRGLDRMEYTQA